jgi:excisionase family DNA binding protein
MEIPQPISIQLPPEFYADLDDRIKKAVAEAVSGAANERKEKSRYLTRKEAAKVLNISLPTLAHYIDKKLLPAVKIGNRVLISEQILNELPLKSKNNNSENR